MFHIIGLQESKLSEIDLIEIESFKIFTKNMKTKSRVSSGGILFIDKQSRDLEEGSKVINKHLQNQLNLD